VPLVMEMVPLAVMAVLDLGAAPSRGPSPGLSMFGEILNDCPARSEGNTAR
jgi:hypothetical protein